MNVIEELDKGRRTFVWGAGSRCKTCIMWLSSLFGKKSCIAIVDKNTGLQGSFIEGIRIISPEELEREYDGEIVVISSESFALEISDELRRIGIKDFIAFSELDVFGDENEKNRDQWVINKLLSIPEGKELLDAGAGEQKYKKYCNHLKYVSQDLCQYNGDGDIGIHRGNWDTSRIDIVSDIIDIPVDDESFDAILCTEVLEHIKDPLLAIKEFSRVLRHGGEVIITAPFCSLTHFAPYHYCTGFNQFWYQEILGNNGLIITEQVRNGNYYKYLGQEARRISVMSRKYCDYNLDEDETNIINRFLYLMEKLNKNDRGSSEMLCYGYHVVARKE